MSIKKELQEIIKDSLIKNDINDINSNEIIIEIPKSQENGDYSTNIALTLTKRLHTSPIEIANKIASNIKIQSYIVIYFIIT